LCYQLDDTVVSRGEDGYALEVFNAIGETSAVVLVLALSVQPFIES
jgi:hypothetical protein